MRLYQRKVNEEKADEDREKRSQVPLLGAHRQWLVTAEAARFSDKHFFFTGLITTCSLVGQRGLLLADPALGLIRKCIDLLVADLTKTKTR